MDHSRMDGKRGHVTCGNRLAIERQESFQKFASLQEELLLPSAQACWDPTRFRMAWYGENDSSSIKWKCFLKSTRDASYILAKEGWPGYEWVLATFLLC